MAPAYIDYALSYKGISPPRDPGDPFRYIDLGCGFGITAILLAAAYPNAEFIGADANPGHIETACLIAEKAGISNITFHCATFDDPVFTEMPAADYVVATGVYTWVPEEARKSLIDLYARLVRKGGAAAISYNMMRGWLPILPVQHLLAEAAAEAQTLDKAGQFDLGRRLVAAVRDSTNASVFEDGVAQFETMLEKTPENYWVHEFLAPGWNPVWSADLAREMARADCTYAGWLDMTLLQDRFSLTGKQRQLLDAAASENETLALRDMFHPRRYTIAAFHRQAEALPDHASRMKGWVRLEKPLDEIEYDCLTPAGRLSFDNETTRAVIDALHKEPASVGSLFDQSELEDEAEFFANIDALIAARQVSPCDPVSPGNRVDDLNAALKELEYDLSRWADIYGTPS